MEWITYILLSTVVTILTYLYLQMTKCHRYWTDRGVAHVKPTPILGNSLGQLTGKVAMFEGGALVYNDFPKEKYVGLYALTTPSLVIRDPELLEKIFVKDFQHFVDHNPERYDKSTMLSLGLFSLVGNQWRSVRNKITPSLTTGKLKIMFDQMLVCADSMVNTLEKNMGEDHLLKEDITSYTIDVASSVIFGIELKDAELRAQYKHYSNNIFNAPPYKFLLLVLANQFPRLAKLLGIKFLDDKMERFFRNIITKTFAQRVSTNYQRNDYIQLLLKLKEQGSIEIKLKDPDDEYLKTHEVPPAESVEITDDLLAAQAFQFMTAGFDPLYNTILLLLFEVALNKEIQDKARNDIKESITKNGDYTYKALKDMTYLEQCIQETLRKYPVIPTLTRLCVKEYALDENLTIEKGIQIQVPLLGLHRDPNYFPDPEKFNPERFHPDATHKNFTFLPFGDGPRVCIGMRFAIMEVKLIVAKVIEKFNLEVSPKTKIPLELDRKSFFISPVNILFNVTKHQPSQI